MLDKQIMSARAIYDMIGIIIDNDSVSTKNEEQEQKIYKGNTPFDKYDNDPYKEVFDPWNEKQESFDKYYYDQPTSIWSWGW